MDKIYFAVIRLTSKYVNYSESEYKIEEDISGVKFIKYVRCWNGTFDQKFEGIQINFAWVNEFPYGTVESKMWCDLNGLKTAKDILTKKLDDFLVDYKSNNGNIVDKIIDKWNNNKSKI